MSRLQKTVMTSAFATGVLFTAPIVTEAALGDQTLRFGMNHPDVKELQELLKEKGYFTYHTATGYYGSITEEAVRRFQQDHRIQTTGIVGPQTLAALLENPTIASSQATVTLTLGAKGDAVRELQQRLKERGYFNHKVTGYFGRITASSVRAFQEKHDFPVTGVATEETIAALTNQPLAVETVYQPSSQISSVSIFVEILRAGSVNDQVKKLQEQLQLLGLYDGPISGQFTTAVEQAAREFQRRQGLRVDGIVGPQTLKALERVLLEHAAMPASPPALQLSTLKLGASGQAVTELQAQLRLLGFFDREPTGNFGAITETAVRAFQRHHQLAQTGEVDGQTTMKLLEEIAKLDTESSEFQVINLIADAALLLGVPYQWGGSTPAGFDCSGFLTYVFAQNGIQLPRTVAEIWDVSHETAEPQVGDLVFFETYTTGPSHAGIYIGNNQFVHSGTSTGVTISSLQERYWSDRYLGARVPVTTRNLSKNVR